MKLANLLRRWAERLDPTPAPEPRFSSQNLQRFRIKYEISRADWAERLDRYRGQLTEDRLVEIVRQEIIVKHAVDLAKIIETEQQNDRLIFTADIYIK